MAKRENDAAKRVPEVSGKAKDKLSEVLENTVQGGEPSESYSTAYDDAFRTILTDCTRLILPVVNEMFGTSYPMDSEVRLYPNERFLRAKGGKELKTISDSYIAVVGNEGIEHSYNIECQSKEDGSMLLRVFEYAVQIALDNREFVEENDQNSDGVNEICGVKDREKALKRSANINENESRSVLEIRMPASGVMYLRSTEGTPSKMTVRMVLPNGEAAEYEVAILKTKEYDLKEIVGKKLYFLIPFHLFKYEGEFDKRERAGNAKKYFARVSEEALKALQEGVDRGDIDLYEMQALREMYLRVTERLAMNYSDTREGVRKTMGGQVLNYEAKEIRNKAIEEGLAEGRAKGLAEGLVEGREKGRAEGRAEGRADVLEAMRLVGVPEDKIFEAMKRMDEYV